MAEHTDDLLTLSFEVGPSHDGWRLDQFVQSRIPRLSRSRIQQMLRAQKRLGGSPLRPAMRVRQGQCFELLRPAPNEPDVPLHYKTLHEDDSLLAIDKPAGLPVHATATFHRNTLAALLARQYEGSFVPRLVHRIDRETSGLMLLARTGESEVLLKNALASREVKKTYLAIVVGDPGKDGYIDAPIGPDVASGIRVKQAVTPDGLPAKTRYERLEQRGGFCLVQALPETGRQHQIRVHLAHIGHPIVGDKLYGSDPGCLFEYLETGWTDSLQERLLLPRHALHAAELRFTHPTTNAPVTLHCPLATDLALFWSNARSANDVRA